MKESPKPQMKFFLLQRASAKMEHGIKTPKTISKNQRFTIQRERVKDELKFLIFFLKKYKVEFIRNGVKFITTSLEWCN